MTFAQAVEEAVKTGHQFRRLKWGGFKWGGDRDASCSYKSVGVNYTGQLEQRYPLHLSVLDMRGDDWFMVSCGDLLFDVGRCNPWQRDKNVLEEGNC